MAAVVGVVMGSDSDLPVMAKAASLLERFKIPYEMKIISAHRTPELMAEYSESAQKRGLKVIIAGAGGAAHLPGVIAAQTHIPVIGVPIQTKALGGVDSLYSIVQMPSGIPVACMAINGAANAAIMAAKMLAIADPQIMERIMEYSAGLKESVMEKSERMDNMGYEKYLEEMKK